MITLTDSEKLKVAKMATQIISASHTKGSAPFPGSRLAEDFKEIYTAIEAMITKD